MKRSLGLMVPHRLLSSSFLWFTSRILKGNPEKELLRSLWLRGPETNGLRTDLNSEIRPKGFVFPVLRLEELGLGFRV